MKPNHDERIYICPIKYERKQSGKDMIAQIDMREQLISSIRLFRNKQRQYKSRFICFTY